jgi:hypothetical protein
MQSLVLVVKPGLCSYVGCRLAAYPLRFFSGGTSAMTLPPREGAVPDPVTVREEHFEVVRPLAPETVVSSDGAAVVRLLPVDHACRSANTCSPPS